jgi:hypothetical protein
MKSQKDLVLEHLERGWSITSLEAWQMYGISRLSDIILKLRRSGYNIETTMVESKTKLGHEARYGTYRMVKE